MLYSSGVSLRSGQRQTGMTELMHQHWFASFAAGQEIYLRRPDAYRLVGCTAAFEQVAELAREQERPETAIGYITQARSAPECMAACNAMHQSL